MARSCGAKRLLSSLLFTSPPSAALLCPHFSYSDPGHPVYDVVTYLPNRSTRQRRHTLGTWHLDSFSTWDALFYDRFKNFGNMTIHLSSDLDDSPMFFMRKDGSVDGSNKRIMDVLASRLNFTYTFTNKSSDREWGDKDVNGTWTGMLGDLYRGEKNMAVNYFLIIEKRAHDFDYSVPYKTEGFGLMLRVPPPLPRWRNLMYPYTGVVWAGVLGVVVVAGFTFYLLNFRRSRSTLLVSLMSILRGIVGQSLTKVPPWWLVRSFLGMWWFSAWILDISYTSNLIAVLTVPVYPSRINTIRELADSKLRLCMLDYGEFVPEALATSTNPVLAKLGAKLDLVPQILSETTSGQSGCVKKVLAGTHAHTETYSYMLNLYTTLGHGSEVYTLKDQLYEGNLAFFFRKNTPWRRKFDVGIQRLVEAGLVQKWYFDIMNELQKKKKKTTRSEPRALSIGHLQGPFLLLALGASLATFVFLIEMFSRIHLPTQRDSHSQDRRLRKAVMALKAPIAVKGFMEKDMMY